jgi:hypothetical protein
MPPHVLPPVNHFVDSSPNRFVGALTTVGPGNHPPNVSIDSHLVNSKSCRVLALKGNGSILPVIPAEIVRCRGWIGNRRPVY